VYPLDTVRTRLAVCHSNEYAGIWATAVRLWQKEGLTAFYRGLVPSMVRAYANAATLYCNCVC
jgi:solute carrier family 25 phosphate transporter 23/24/25/41